MNARKCTGSGARGKPVLPPQMHNWTGKKPSTSEELMKFNKWTIGLAAVGVVSLASAAKADEKLSAVQTALSSTTISGYVDTSAQWNFGTGTGANFYKFGGENKSDGFNLNVVQLSLAK